MSEALGSSLLMLSAAQQYSHGVGALTASHQQQQSPSATSLPSFASILHPPGISQPSYSNQSPNAKASVSTYLPPISSFQAPNFPPLADFLRRLSLLQYLPVFLEEGFNEVAVLCDITEDDFAAMDVKRGHRRTIQREIASMRGIDRGQSLEGSAIGAGGEDDRSSHTVSDLGPPIAMLNATDQQAENKSAPAANQSIAQPQAKRKYRRHPKPDPSAPEKPPSAYVTFSNDVREDVKDKSFTEIARIVGDRWKQLDEPTKATYEGNAARAKEDWLIKMNEYKRTDDYAKHLDYVKEFRTRHPKESKKGKSASTTPVSLIGTPDPSPIGGGPAANTRKRVVSSPKYSAEGRASSANGSKRMRHESSYSGEDDHTPSTSYGSHPSTSYEAPHNPYPASMGDLAPRPFLANDMHPSVMTEPPHLPSRWSPASHPYQTSSAPPSLHLSSDRSTLPPG